MQASLIQPEPKIFSLAIRRDEKTRAESIKFILEAKPGIVMYLEIITFLLVIIADIIMKQVRVTFLSEVKRGKTIFLGDKNVFIGTSAGYNETGSNKLYIDNSSTSSPLIYGDFGTADLTINGDLTVTGTITELSDRRYKTDIEPIKNALQKIEAINAVYYKWDKEKYPDLVVSDEREIGVIAQDVEKVFPELVKTDKEGFKSVNYAKLSAVLLQVVKEQQVRIENLEKKYSEQTNAIYELTEAFYSLQKENEIKMSSNIK